MAVTPPEGWPGPYPTMFPGVVLTAVLALIVSGPVARRLQTTRGVAWLLVAGLGWTLAITIAPSRLALEVGVPWAITCDLSRVGPAPLHDYLRFQDPFRNILLFIPLGGAIGLLGRPYRRRLAILAACLPLAIEITQWLVAPLGRACEGGDLFDNLLGLGIGIMAGMAAGAIVARRRRDPR